MSIGILYIVATPIGNLGDFSQRAIDTLQSVDLIACEDTRVTQKLLNHFKINTKTVSYHKFSERERSAKLLEYLQNGKDLALVSDAGTPLISDPGSILVEVAKNAGIKVVPIPGCSALITTLSSIPNDGKFAFLGFFPQKQSEIQPLLNFAKDFNLIFYESPNRILKTLDIVKSILGEVKISIARELTKIHEDINTMEISDMINYLENSTLKGELVLVIHKLNSTNYFEFSMQATKLLQNGYSAKDVANILSLLFDIPKNEIKKQLNK